MQKQIEPSLVIKDVRSESRSRILLLFVEAFSALAGFLGGIPLIIAPNGSLLSLPRSLLSQLPVSLSDFLLVGVWLTLGFGVGFSLTSYLLWTKKAYSWYAALGLCIIWLGQISAEMFYFGPNWVDEVWYIPQAAALILLVATRRQFLQPRLQGKDPEGELIRGLVVSLENVENLTAPLLTGSGVKVLVGYASKAGSTKGIAEFVGEKLRNGGAQVDVKDVSSVTDLAGYDAFVIGSAVYMWHWMKEAKQFVSENRSVLASRPVWIFSSGPTGPSPVDKKGRDLKEVSGPKEIDELRESIHPRDHQVFFGAFYPERLKGMTGWFGRRIPEEDRGDFRNWNEIESWTNTIARDLLTAQQISK